MSKHQTMGDSLRAIAARVDELNKQYIELAGYSADYSLMVEALRRMTDTVSDAYAGDDADMQTAEHYGVGEEIRQAAAILLHAAPPLREWAEKMLAQWKKPAATRKGRGSK